MRSAIRKAAMVVLLFLGSASFFACKDYNDVGPDPEAPNDSRNPSNYAMVAVALASTAVLAMSRRRALVAVKR